MLLSMILATLVTPSFALDATGNANFAMVRGVVTDRGRPLPNVRVLASGDTDVRETWTDANGQYYFMTLLPGVYQIHAFNPNPPGFVDSRTSLRCLEDSMELSAGQLYEADLTISRNCP